MDNQQALAVISALSEGIDPETGELLPAESSFNKPQVIRALFSAKTCIQQAINAEKRRAERPENAGKPWNEAEDGQLASRFDSGQSVEQLAKSHGRTRGAITARLIHLGKIAA